MFIYVSETRSVCPEYFLREALVRDLKTVDARVDVNLLNEVQY